MSRKDKLAKPTVKIDHRAIRNDHTGPPADPRWHPMAMPETEAEWRAFSHSVRDDGHFDELVMWCDSLS